MLHDFELVELVFEILVLDEKPFDVLSRFVPASERRVLSEQLFDAWDQLQLFFRRQILILVEQELKLLLKALNELVEGHLVLVISQLRQLLHRAVRFVASEDHRVQKLSHHEEVVDFLAQDVLKGQPVLDLELAVVFLILR